MTSKLVIHESESPRSTALSILISQMTSSSIIISYLTFIHFSLFVQSLKLLLIEIWIHEEMYVFVVHIFFLSYQLTLEPNLLKQHFIQMKPFFIMQGTNHNYAVLIIHLSFLKPNRAQFPLFIINFQVNW